MLARFNDLCGMDHASDTVFCDCSIVEASKSLPPLRVFIAERPFQLPVEEMFTRVSTMNGQEMCELNIQPNSMDFHEDAAERPRPLPLGGLGGQCELCAAGSASS